MRKLGTVLKAVVVQFFYTILLFTNCACFPDTSKTAETDSTARPRAFEEIAGIYTIGHNVATGRFALESCTTWKIGELLPSEVANELYLEPNQDAESQIIRIGTLFFGEDQNRLSNFEFDSHCYLVERNCRLAGGDTETALDLLVQPITMTNASVMELLREVFRQVRANPLNPNRFAAFTHVVESNRVCFPDYLFESLGEVTVTGPTVREAVLHIIELSPVRGGTFSYRNYWGGKEGNQVVGSLGVIMPPEPVGYVTTRPLNMDPCYAGAYFFSE